MKYPFKKSIHEIISVKNKGKIMYTLRSSELTRSNDSDELAYVYTRRFGLVDTYEEAQAMLQKANKGRILMTDMLNVSSGAFKQFYGCAYCADALDKYLNPIAERDEDYIRAVFCKHNECPYAEEIEKHDGYNNMIKDMGEDMNYCFASLFENIDYFRG